MIRYRINCKNLKTNEIIKGEPQFGTLSKILEKCRKMNDLVSNGPHWYWPEEIKGEIKEAGEDANS